MSLLVTSPPLAYTVLPSEPSPLRKGLWLTILATALPSLLYHSSGYIQLGYRFSLDYMIFFMVLLAVEQPPADEAIQGPGRVLVRREPVPGDHLRSLHASSRTTTASSRTGTTDAR